MMVSSSLLLLFSVFLVTTARPKDEVLEVERISAIINRYGDNLLDVLGSEEGNVFYSPTSISTVLSALYVGAKGDTRRELGRIGYNELEGRDFSIPISYKKLFGILQSNSDRYKLEIANALITQADYPLLEEYKEILTSSYHALIKEVDFVNENDRAVQEVNDWVNEKTHGKIDKLVEKLDKSTRLVLLNAIYFKGTWQTEFDPQQTKQRLFYNNGIGPAKDVPTMHTKAKYPYLYDEENQLRALQLRYKGGDVSMVILLPFEENGISRIQTEISSDKLYDIITRLEETEVDVAIPKFKLEYSRSLKDDIRNTGIKSIFEPTADLSGITGSRDLFVSDVVHKAVVEVNEEGSEAAAVTGVIVVETSLVLPFDKYEFKADHPFIFYIVDHRTKTNLFVGRVSGL